MSALRLLSIVIPARDEADCIGSTVEHLTLELRRHGIDHEVVLVDDGSTDGTWEKMLELQALAPQVKPVQNTGAHGFGRAVILGLDRIAGDAVVIMMADESDDCRDVVRYWNVLQEGADCVFGSRFVEGGGTIDYPPLKLAINRIANTFLSLSFGMSFNDTTNAFKAYRREVIEGCRPLISSHFNLTVELPLKAVVRGYRWTAIPITWKNRRTGGSHFKLKEMGSRYLFIVLYLWLEKHLSRGVDKRNVEGSGV